MSATSPGVALVLEALEHADVQEALRRVLGDKTAPPSTRVAYTVPQLAAEVGMTPRGIRAAIERGDLRGTKTGGRWIVSADAVRQWANGGSGNRAATRRCSPSVRPARRSGGLAATFAAMEGSNR